MGAGNALFAVAFKKLVKQGFAVPRVDYRFVKKDGTVSCAIGVIDSKDAIRYLSKNSESLGIDPCVFTPWAIPPEVKSPRCCCCRRLIVCLAIPLWQELLQNGGGRFLVWSLRF